MEKQIERAKLIIEKPSQSKKIKFTKTNNQKIELNQTLIEKSIKLLGIKGYFTDIEEQIVSMGLNKLNREILNLYFKHLICPKLN